MCELSIRATVRLTDTDAIVLHHFRPRCNADQYTLLAAGVVVTQEQIFAILFNCSPVFFIVGYVNLLCRHTY